MPILLLVIPVLSTLSGGLLALRFRRSLLLLAALGAGLLLGAAFLDLLPEAIALGAGFHVDAARVLGITLISFLSFFAIEVALDALSARWTTSAPRRIIGRIAASMLVFHSFRDGIAIGLSYAASHSAGYAVAAGIAAHDIGDGMNTIVLTTRGEDPELSDYLFLAADSLAPLLGGLATAYWLFSAQSSAILLAVAAGFFIQMAASGFLPEVRRGEGSRLLVLIAVLSGALIIYAANQWMGTMQ